MKITLARLKKLGACNEALGTYFVYRKSYDAKELFSIMYANGHDGWIRWGLVRLMTRKQCIEWAIYCASKVLKIYEDKYPYDKRPRKAINSAKKYLKNPSSKNKNAAADAADAAAYAAYAADAAAYAAYAARASAYAAYAARAAADSAADAADAAAYAARAADVATYAADADINKQLLQRGLSILLRGKQ